MYYMWEESNIHPAKSLHVWVVFIQQFVTSMCDTSAANKYILLQNGISKIIWQKCANDIRA